jgi:hypothetical protein
MIIEKIKDIPKKIFLISIAALFLTTGAAHASAHSTFFECGPYRMVSIFQSTPEEYYWVRVSTYDCDWKRISPRAVKEKGKAPQTVGFDKSGQPIIMNVPITYYRGQKCEEISRAQAIEKWQ